MKKLEDIIYDYSEETDIPEVGEEVVIKARNFDRLVEDIKAYLKEEVLPINIKEGDSWDRINCITQDEADGWNRYRKILIKIIEELL